MASSASSTILSKVRTFRKSERFHTTQMDASEALDESSDLLWMLLLLLLVQTAISRQLARDLRETTFAADVCPAS